VSIVVTTTPGPHMHDGDRLKLHRLVNRVAGYLRGYPPDTIDDVMGRLRALAQSGSEAPVEGGVQLTVGPGLDEVRHLPTAQIDRVILEPTPVPVAIRPTLGSDPADHRVLVLADHEIRLFDSVRGALYEVRDGVFPVTGTPVVSGPRPFRDRDRDRRPGGVGGRRQQRRRRLCARADEALTRSVSTRPAPVVVVGSRRDVRMFREITGHADLIVAEVTGNYGRTPPNVLAPIVNRRLAARRAI
jgi:hypothetical protein